MSTTAILEKIKNVYRIKYDGAIGKLAILEKDCLEATKQLNEIVLYFNEYCDFFKRQVSHGLSGYQLKNQYQFINQFTPVISQQNNIIAQIQNKISEQKIVLYNCYKDLKALEYLLDKKNTMLAALKYKEETAQQEDEFLSLYINKK